MTYRSTSGNPNHFAPITPNQSVASAGKPIPSAVPIPIRIMVLRMPGNRRAATQYPGKMTIPMMANSVATDSATDPSANIALKDTRHLCKRSKRARQVGPI